MPRVDNRLQKADQPDINEVVWMRVLIFGAAGMLGHKLYQQFHHRYDTWATVRTSYTPYARFKLFNPERLCGGVEATDFPAVERMLRSVQPDVIINCIGTGKYANGREDTVTTIMVNALFPHQLSQVSRELGARLIQISTDNIFAGRNSMYTEDEPADAGDLYGRTKLLGEVDDPGTLTLRTAAIGREMNGGHGLVEWFLSNRPNGSVRGFRQSIYTGFTTVALADIIADVIDNHPQLSGIYHVSSEPISKYELLLRLRDAFETEIEVEPDDAVEINRSLDSTRFREATGFVPPTWKRMIEQMAADPTSYDHWHQISG
jgi:dTDP-4-dehydrorhamnose reductase